MKKGMKEKLFLFIVAVIAALFFVNSNMKESAASENNRKQLVFVTPENEGILTRYQVEVFREVSRRTGVEFIIMEIPKKRCLYDVNNGKYDGLPARIEGLENSGYPNLKIIGVSHFTVQHVLFAKNQNIMETVNDLKSLIEQSTKNDYRIGLLRGSKKAEKLLSKLPKENKYDLDNAENGFELLDAGRLEAYLAGPGIVNRAILKKKFGQSGIKELCVLSNTPLFSYVHTKHSQMIPIIEKALQSMKDDGTLNKIRILLE